MTVRMRHTRSHTGNRRAHHALKNLTLVADKESGVVHLRHRASPTTGLYRGRSVVDMNAKLVKKQKKLKAKKQALGKEAKGQTDAK